MPPEKADKLNHFKMVNKNHKGKTSSHYRLQQSKILLGILLTRFEPFVTRLFGRVFVALNFNLNMVGIIEITSITDSKSPKISLWATVDFVSIFSNTPDDSIIFILIEREGDMIHPTSPLLDRIFL